MEFFFVGAMTLLAAMYPLYQPMLDSFDFPSHITGLRKSIADLTLKIISEYDGLPEGTPVSGFWHATESGPAHVFPSQSWQETAASFQSRLSGAYKPNPFIYTILFFVFAILGVYLVFSIGVALAQWREYNKVMTEKARTSPIQPVGSGIESFHDTMMKKNHEFVSGQMNDFKTALLQVMESVKQTQGMFREQMAALKPQENLQTQLQDFETRLAEIKTATGKNMDAQVKQLQEQMISLKPQDLLEKFEADWARMKNAASKDMEAKAEQLMDPLDGRMISLKELENRTHILYQDLSEWNDTAGKAVEDVKQQSDHLMRDLAEKKKTACKAIDAQEQLRKEDLKIKMQDLQDRKKAFDAMLKTFEQRWDTELGQVHNKFDALFQKVDLQARINSQMSLFEAEVGQKRLELAADFDQKARDGLMAILGGPERVQQLVVKILKELILHEISSSSSGDFQSFVGQRVDELVKEHVPFSLPDLDSTNSPERPSKLSRRTRWRMRHPGGSVEVPEPGMAATTTTPSSGKTEQNVPKPQGKPHAGLKESTSAPWTGPASPVTTADAKGNAGEASKPLEKPSPSLQSSRYEPQASPASSEAGPSRSKVADVPKPQGGLASSIHAAPASPSAPASPTVPQTRDKGKQPMRNETKEVSGPSKGPSQTPKGDVSGRSSAPRADDHKGDLKVFGLQDSKDAPQAPKGPSGAKIEAKGPSTSQAVGIAREFVPRQPSSQSVNAQGFRKIPPAAQYSQSIKANANTSTTEPSRFDPEIFPNLPKLPPRRPRAAVVGQKHSFGQVFAGIGGQADKERPPARPTQKMEVGGLAPVKKDPTKADPGPAVPKEPSKALSLVDKGKAKEGSGPALWSDLVDADLQRLKGSPGASQPTAAPPRTSVPAAAGIEPSRPAPLKEGSTKVHPGVAELRWAPQPGTDAPTPPAAAEKANELPSVPPGLAKSIWADTVSTEDAGKAPLAEKKGPDKKPSGVHRGGLPRVRDVEGDEGQGEIGYN
ncbi:uncharacterized protein KD926_007289 [Aspergillus affinis]|uniref:uncharacterized protein n=1 Tax=Aspergillus affinis TaxID=1070780 RepID=UPI0022FE5136|nr:uncharacterized protein KD926_007289 [Aspergillus affinis]KAI9041178.1 hypothetical protein KD926_007289 [Aspergillus affinis]